MSLFAGMAEQMGVNFYTKSIPTKNLTAKDKTFLKKIRTAGAEARSIISGKSKALTMEEFFK